MMVEYRTQAQFYNFVNPYFMIDNSSHNLTGGSYGFNPYQGQVTSHIIYYFFFFFMFSQKENSFLHKVGFAPGSWSLTCDSPTGIANREPTTTGAYMWRF